VLTADVDEGPTFFDGFDYFTGWDPTHGFVPYVDAEGARAQNLTHISDEDTAILRVDTSDKNATTGRRSVRILSKKTYTAGLFIFDIIHSPHGCATWPALWLSDLDTWPAGGEIDVMESVNVGDTGNQMTLHTTGGCKIGRHRSRKQTGEVMSNDCYNGTNYNQGVRRSGSGEFIRRDLQCQRRWCIRPRSTLRRHTHLDVQSRRHHLRHVDPPPRSFEMGNPSGRLSEPRVRH
jgi:hypothetical protein